VTPRRSAAIVWLISITITGEISGGGGGEEDAKAGGDDELFQRNPKTMKKERRNKDARGKGGKRILLSLPSPMSGVVEPRPTGAHCDTKSAHDTYYKMRYI